MLLADLTTFHIGGPADRFERTTGPQELADAVAEADRAGEPLLVLGGGSNLLVADVGFPGVVVQDMSQSIDLVENSACGGATLRASAGTSWDSLVQFAINHELMGVEALSGIPGTVGAAPVQNIGAYGQEAAETLASARVFDRLTGRQRTLALTDLHLGYRNSMIKRSLSDPEVGGGRTWGPTGRWVVLEVEFQMRNASLSSPLRYRELATVLGIGLGERAPSSEVREAVLALRRGKGMVLDPADNDTWSAGSFFTNPVLTQDAADGLPADAPRFPVERRSLAAGISGRAPNIPGVLKTSAAWLIGQAGFTRGYRATPDAPASLSTKHVLALTNRGDATAEDILGLARAVRTGVESSFGVTLVPEPVLVGCSL